MLRRIFPRQFDNIFRGHWLAIWVLLPVVLLELVIGANSVINTRSVAMGADGIPLDRFGPEAATTAVSLFALLGLSRLLFGLMGVMALIRYRAMIPFIYLLLLVLQLGSKALLLLHPAIRSIGHNTAAGSTVILVLIGMLLTGFVLSLLGRPDPQAVKGAPRAIAPRALQPLKAAHVSSFLRRPHDGLDGPALPVSPSAIDA